MDSFHLSERAPVAQAIEAAGACNTLDELYAAMEAYDGHDVAEREATVRPFPTDVENPLMILAEKPEPEDHDAKAPFSGDYGAVMREVLNANGIDLADVHTTYCIHWAPEDDKTPNSTQISASRPFLFREIELVKPRAILIPGRTALEALTMIRQPLTPLLGQSVQWKRGDFRTQGFIVWHPAYAHRFRTQTPEYSRQIAEFVERFGLPRGDGGTALQQAA